MYCAHCGALNESAGTICVKCGQPVQAYSPPSVPVSDGTMGGLIPYKNASALTAYYCSVFALIPCLGLFLGPAGVILGMMGIRYAKEHPEAKGVAHAWVGIILGGLCGLANLSVVALMVASYISQTRH